MKKNTLEKNIREKFVGFVRFAAMGQIAWSGDKSGVLATLWVARFQSALIWDNYECVENCKVTRYD